MRGKVQLQPGQPAALGITPACAGKRATPSKNPHPGGDHPRVCGEKQLGKNATDYTLGSPPRVRGKVSVDEVNVFHGGITPACAGKRSSLFFTPLCCRDHPRVCGEKLTDYQLFWQKGGSPPRVRGKVEARVQHRDDPGITPACAGKSNGEIGKINNVRDHPRVCGEKHCPRCHSTDVPGSPPRVRGKAEQVGAQIWALRDHPRVCGEKPPSASSSKAGPGITPACAGKRHNAKVRGAKYRDHPRVCGEKTKKIP